MKEKIEKIKSLSRQIEELSYFISVVYGVQKKPTKSETSRSFPSKLELCGYISTGSDSPRYSADIVDEDTVLKIIISSTPILEEILSNKRKELDSLVK